MFESGMYYRYNGPTFLSGEVAYGDTVKYIGPVMAFFVTVQKLTVEKILTFEVPGAHLGSIIKYDEPHVERSNDPLQLRNAPLQRVKEGIMLGKDEIQKRVGFHKATVEGPNATLPRHREIRQDFVQFMNFLDWMLPDGRTKSIAMTHLEDASMWAHKSISETAPLVDEEGDGEARRTKYLEDARQKVRDGSMSRQDYINLIGKDAFSESLKNVSTATDDAPEVWVDSDKKDFRIGGLGDGVAEVDGPQ